MTKSGYGIGQKRDLLNWTWIVDDDENGSSAINDGRKWEKVSRDTYSE